MPLYDYKCPNCGDVEREILLSLAEHEEGIECCWCSTKMSTIISAVATIGPMPSKPYRLGGADVEITSVEDLRAYQKKNPTHKVVSKDDSWWRKHKDNAREGAERQARGQGYRDWGQRQERVRADNKRKKELGG